MTPEDLKRVIKWIGPEGAVAGLEKSNLTNAELMLLARNSGHSVDKRAARRQLSVELVMSSQKRINKDPEFLLDMSSDELKRYFLDRMVSEKELFSLLSELGIAPSGKVRGKLVDYAAREIGELGMFQRVARGSNTSAQKPR